ncbi:MAG TPA: LysR family transcriptional regulator [Bradyrhizobium sp.]|nr:LysR family transcriptional regulator [Bradyrhizobium sp.]
MSLQSIDLAPPGPRNGNTAQSALLRRIDLTTLRLFIAVCEEKNLTRAASREGIAASAVSKRMADFELAFGVTLFERLSKGMVLTLRARRCCTMPASRFSISKKSPSN